MFLLTQDEIDAGCTEARDDPGLTAKPFDGETTYEASCRLNTVEPGQPTPLIVAEALKDVFDPEIPVNIYDLGLIYDINVSADGAVGILMTLTSPNCPVAGILPGEVAEAAATVKGVSAVGVEMTFEVPWNPDMMSEIAKTALGMY